MVAFLSVGRSGPGVRALGGALLLLCSCGMVCRPGAAAVRVGPEHVFPGRDVGSCDIAVHPATGQPHVVWETKDGHIKRCAFDGTRWGEAAQIPGPEGVGARHDRFRNGAVTMVIDEAGRLHVVYTTVGPPNGLYHIQQVKAGGEWSKPVQIHDGRSAALIWVQMAGGRGGELFVTFEQGFRAFRCERSGGKWRKAAPVIGMTSHCHYVAVGPDGVPRIVFKAKRAEGYEAYVAVRRRGGWKAEQITRDGGHVDSPSGAIDAKGRLHVLWNLCEEEGHAADLKYGVYAGSIMPGAAIAKSNAHSFCRLVIDADGAFYAFIPRRYPPKFVVREPGGRQWSAPIAFGEPRQGYWFFEAAAHGKDVHVVYSNWYGTDRRKPVTYRNITRAAGPAPEPRRQGVGLRPDPDNARWLLCGDKHVALSGNGLWVLLPDTDVDPVKHNEHAARWGATSNRTSLFSGCDRVNGGELAPWARTGPGKANDGGPKYDLSRFDERYWRRAAQYVEDAVKRGIYPLIQVWCEPLVERGEGRWIVHPFNPDNHINRIPKLPTGSADAGRDGIFYDMGNRRLLRFQEAFVRKALDELGRFPVLWDIGNEVGLDTRIDDAWMKHWADFFDAYEAAHAGVGILSTVDTSGDRGHFDRIANLDVVNVHGFKDSNPFSLTANPEKDKNGSRVDVKAMQRRLDRHYQRYRKPLVNTRITADPDYAGRILRDRPGNALETRHILWGYFFGGAHFISFRNPDATGACPKAWDAPPLTTEKAQRALRAFIDSFEFWKCEPRVAGIVSGGDAVVLAEAGRQYAFYAPNGKRFVADLSDAKGGRFRARWFDPRAGRFQPPRQVAAGPAVAFALPTDEDWALLLEREEARRRE